MEAVLSTGAAAMRLGVSVKTLQRWDREGRLVPSARTPGGRRLYSESQLLRQLGRQPPVLPQRVLAYCRVSSAAHKAGLREQRRVIEEFAVARGLANVEFLEEIGGALDVGRRGLLDLTDAIARREVVVLVLAHRDRLLRFGFEWFEHFAAAHGCELLVLNQERLSPEAEMIQDLARVVQDFARRLHGLQRYRRQLDAALKQDLAHAPDASHAA